MIRPAHPDELPAVMNVLDGAYLDVDAGVVRERIANGEVLVADEEGRILGAIVIEPQPTGAFVEAVAVRRRRRGDGLGTALVLAAGDRFGRLRAEFDADVRPFYERLGFAIEPPGGWGGECDTANTHADEPVRFVGVFSPNQSPDGHNHQYRQ